MQFEWFILKAGGCILRLSAIKFGSCSKVQLGPKRLNGDYNYDLRKKNMQILFLFIFFISSILLYEWGAVWCSHNIFVKYL